MTCRPIAIAHEETRPRGLRAAILAFGLAAAMTLVAGSSLAAQHEAPAGPEAGDEELIGERPTFDAMRETMRKAREAEDPAERRALMRQHMEMMGGRMQAMRGGMGAMRGGHRADRRHGETSGDAEAAEAPDMMEMMDRHHAHMDEMMAMMERRMAMMSGGCEMMRGHGKGAHAMGQYGATRGGRGHGGMMKGGGMMGRGPDAMGADRRVDAMEQMMEQMLDQQRMMMEMMQPGQ